MRMKLQEVRAKLAGPLIFGDPQQLAAVREIEQVEEIADRMRQERVEIFLCATCDGTGEHTCQCGNGHGCPDCDETGFKNYAQLPSWIFDADREAVMEAIKILRASR